MGRAKEEWMRSCDRGYDLLDSEFVCINCVINDFLKEVHSEDARQGDCSYCERTGVPVTEAERIQVQIMDCLLADYQDIQNSGAPYETREGGWQINHEMAQEIVAEQIESAVGQEFLEAIVDAVHSDVSWCEREWTILSPIARLHHGWNQFCMIVRNRLRFSFFLAETTEDPKHPDYTHPSLTLEEIGELVDFHGLIRTVEAGAIVYRVRVDEVEYYDTLGDLGSGPPTSAAANRMSPAGIPMFYCADEAATAVAETWDAKTPVRASIAKFELIKLVRIIDFTKLPDAPSYWSNPDRGLLAQYHFLHHLVSDLSLPVKLNSKVDLDYAPTQIVSEYLTKARYGYPSSYNPPSSLVHGLAFNSSKTGGMNYGLNLLKDSDPYSGIKQDEFVRLLEVEHRGLIPSP